MERSAYATPERGVHLIKVDFQEFCERLTTYFGQRKTISPEQFDYWFREIKHLPHASLNFIESCIKRDFDLMPKNLPRHMKIYYIAWHGLNTTKTIGYERTRCKPCGNRGFIFVEREAKVDGALVMGPQGPLTEKTVYRCAKCENWRGFVHPEAMPAITIDTVRKNGWVVI